jgi:toxin ParE1/3/4
MSKRSGRAAVVDSLLYTWRAEEDLAAIFRRIARSDPDRARKYVRSIEDRCESLLDFPFQRKARDDLLPGIRAIPFVRSVVIAYRVFPEGVRIERIFSAGQDYEAIIKSEK